MAAAEAAGNAPAGRQAGGKANAADTDVYVERAVWLPIAVALLSDDARKYGKPVSIHVELRILPNGELYICRGKRDRHVWQEIEELIDP